MNRWITNYKTPNSLATDTELVSSCSRNQTHGWPYIPTIAGLLMGHCLLKHLNMMGLSNDPIHVWKQPYTIFECEALARWRLTHLFHFKTGKIALGTLGQRPVTTYTSHVKFWSGVNNQHVGC